MNLEIKNRKIEALELEREREQLSRASNDDPHKRHFGKFGKHHGKTKGAFGKRGAK